MITIFDRIYYTLLKGNKKVEDFMNESSELPRTKIVFFLSLLNGINFLGLSAIISKLTEFDIIIHSPLQTIVAGAIIISIHFWVVFTRKRYLKIESFLSERWLAERGKNMAITSAFLILSILFGCLVVWILKTT